ncbi:hypothetical protein BSKO_07299 [Bryopsis sp. KO-2023]|nr:hypothetical protein BSKO_07299 [Bryopsis sp. KO-2023]
MYNFKGEFVSRKKVDLRGRSREENREQVLQRTRREREKRKRQKLECESATRIQATWRAHVARTSFKKRVRSQWISSHGSMGENIDGSALSLTSTCIPELLVIIDVRNTEDIARLCAVCNAILTTHEAGQVAFCRDAGGSPEEYRFCFNRTIRLMWSCLKALENRRSMYLQDLASPYNPANGSQAGVLLKFLLDLSNTDTWSGVLGQEKAQRLTAALTQNLVKLGMFRILARLVKAACPMKRRDSGTPAAEFLASRLLVLYWRIEQRSNGVEIEDVDGPLRLLSVGCLWQRCPSFKRFGGRMCSLAFTHTESLEPEILHALQQEEETMIETALSILGNVVQLGEGAVAFRGENEEQGFCHRLPSVMFGLLVRLPLGRLFSMDIIDDSDEDAVGPSYYNESSTSEWDATGVAPELVSAVDGLFGNLGQDLLAGLVKGILPHVRPCVEVVDPGVLRGAAALCGLLQLVLKTHSQVQRQRLLLSLAVSGEFIQRVWYSLLRPSGDGVRQEPQGMEKTLRVLIMLCQVYSCFLVTAGSEEVCGKQEPLPLKELYDPASANAGLISLLKQCLWQVIWVANESAPVNRSEQVLYREFEAAAGKLLCQLYDMNVRWKFAPSYAFHISDAALFKFVPEATSVTTALDDSGDPEPEENSRAFRILSHAPCVIPFQDRAKVFTAQVEHDRSKSRASVATAIMNEGHRFVTIRRSQLLYDGFNQLNEMGDELKSRVRIRFIDEHGLPEAGVDGGGLFKDFLEELVRIGFDPQYGLFTATEDHLLYPNPASPHLQPDALEVLTFLGRMLGKAVYEGILLELPLAGFFLKKFRSSFCDINDLPTLDPEMYRSLLLLRNYPGNVSDLSVNFTVIDSVYGDNREVELKSGGKDIPVTNDNAIEYIHRVADFRLNKQVRSVSRAFLQGFFSIIRPEWVKMFSAAELQSLISGSEEGLNLADMQANVEYASGYHEEHPVIKTFWESMAAFSPGEQRSFLRFVTACSRAPLLGFRYLQPKMCIQMAGSVLDGESMGRLPTAATCMNLLKLPPYNSKEVMLEKLRYAINSGAGFDLS